MGDEKRDTKLETTYPEGTRWAVRRVVDGKRSIVVEPEPRSGCAAGATSWPTIAEAKRVLWTMRALWWGEDYRLVRIPPPRPKRSVEERIAEAVRERTAPILHIVEGQREHLRRSIRQRTTEEHLDAIITLLRDLRDGISALPKRSVEDRIAEAVKTERAAVRGEIDEAVFEARKAELVRADKRIAEAVKAAVDAAVRERTEAILTEWQAPWSESKRRPFEQHFAEWLRDLRDGKVAT